MISNKVFSARQMRELDEATIQGEPIESIELMERAAEALFEAFRLHYAPDVPVVVFAGSGNNGGDGLALARKLIEGGYEVKSFLFNTSGKVSPDCKINAERLQRLESAHFVEVTQQLETPQIAPDAVIVDALFGTGLSRPLSGGFAALVKFINSSGREVVSIDMPSGLLADGQKVADDQIVVRARRTLTLGGWKLSLLLDENAPFCGHVECLDIQLSGEHAKKMATQVQVQGPSEAASLLKERPETSHKGTFGHALLIAGSFGSMGCAMLSAEAALRTGLGKLTVHLPRLCVGPLVSRVPEAVVSIDDADDHFSSLPAGDYAALAVGPGLGTDSRTVAALTQLLHVCQKPVLLDADALNILAQHREMWQYVVPGSIITPHPLEFERLFGHRSDLTLLAHAREQAASRGIFIILKGHRTAICTPRGQTYLNLTGNNGLATAGTGDVLTGMLLSLLAQGYDPETTCRLGVCLHGLAADTALAHVEPEAMLARDVVAHISDAFRKIKTFRP